MNHYKTLKIQDFSTEIQVKNSFKKLCLQHHPDKVSLVNNNGSLNSGTPQQASDLIWHSILNAYQVLVNPLSKKAFDQQLAKTATQISGPLQDEVDLDDMECSVFENNVVYWKYKCRCDDGEFIVTEQDLEDGVDIVECNSCSLNIKVLYQQLEED